MPTSIQKIAEERWMSQTLKKRLLLVLMVALCVLLVAVPVGCKPGEEDPDKDNPGGTTGDTVTAITVTSGTDISIELGESHQITWTVEPETVVNNGVTFSSSDAKIAKVNRNTGLVQALDRGEATITLTSNQNPQVTATVDITVTNVTIADANKFTVELNPAVYPMGEVLVDAEELPENASAVVTLKSGSVDEVFTGTIDNKGSFLFDMSEKQVTAAGVYEIGVAFPGNETLVPETVKFHDIAVKEYLLMTDGWENGGDGKLESDSTIALKGDQDWGHVFKEYEVNLTSRRYITVKAATIDNKWSIKLVSPLVELANNEYTIDEWDSSTKEYTVDLGKISWFKEQTGDFDVVVKIYTIGPKADDPKVVIDNITIHGGLKAEIAAVKPADYKPVTAIGDIEKQYLSIGNDVQITPVLTPEDVSFGILVWSSSDETVVTVDGLGKLHPVNPGDATITVRTLDGTVSKTFDVNVRVAVTAVKVSKASASIGLDVTQEFDLGALVSVLPANATNKNVTYQIVSGNEFVDSISAEGVVKMKAAGTVEIDIISADNAKIKTSFTLTALEGNVVLPEGMEIVTPDGSTELFYYSLTQLSVTFTNDPTDKTVSWSTETPDIVRVDATQGKVRALRNGTAVVVAVANADDSVVAKIELTVTSSYAYAFDPASYDWLLLNFVSTKEKKGSTLQAGDQVKVIASMAGKEDKTFETTAGGTDPGLVMIRISDLGLTEVGTYSFSVEVKRNGELLEGYAYEGASLLSEGSNILDIPRSEWTPQDANFSIDGGIATISKTATSPGWGHAAARVTFNLQEYPYLMFMVDEMPAENMQFDVKLSNVGEAADEGLITGVKSQGMYLYDLRTSGNSKIKDKTGDFDVTFRLFYVGSSPDPIKFSGIRLLSPQTNLISEEKDPVLPTAFELEQTQFTLNALDSSGNSGKIVAASFAPENVTFKGLMFESADPAIASVDASGTIVGLKAGETTITVRCIAAPDVTKTVNVTVTETAAEYTLITDLSTHNKLTVELIGVEDGTEMTLNITGQSAIKANAQNDAVTFDIPSDIGAGENTYTFTVTGGVTGNAYATQKVFAYDLSKGPSSGNNYAITANGDGNYPNPTLEFANGAYYNKGNGWGNVGVAISNFDPDDYTYFEVEITGTTGAAGVKVNIHAATNNTLLVENAVAQAGGARVARIDMSLFAAKIPEGETQIVFRNLVVGDGEADKAMFGFFSAYHIADATRGV